MVRARSLLRGHASTPSWSEAGDWSLPSRSREEQINRIAARMLTRVNVNASMLLDLISDVAASDPLERPADLVDHVAEGIGERKDLNERAVNRLKRNLRDVIPGT